MLEAEPDGTVEVSDNEVENDLPTMDKLCGVNVEQLTGSFGAGYSNPCDSPRLVSSDYDICIGDNAIPVISKLRAGRTCEGINYFRGAKDCC